MRKQQFFSRIFRYVATQILLFCYKSFKDFIMIILLATKSSQAKKRQFKCNIFNSEAMGEMWFIQLLLNLDLWFSRHHSHYNGAFLGVQHSLQSECFYPAFSSFLFFTDFLMSFVFLVQFSNFNSHK